MSSLTRKIGWSDLSRKLKVMLLITLVLGTWLAIQQYALPPYYAHKAEQRLGPYKSPKGHVPAEVGHRVALKFPSAGVFSLSVVDSNYKIDLDTDVDILNADELDHFYDVYIELSNVSLDPFTCKRFLLVKKGGGPYTLTLELGPTTGAQVIEFLTRKVNVPPGARLLLNAAVAQLQLLTIPVEPTLTATLKKGDDGRLHVASAGATIPGIPVFKGNALSRLAMPLLVDALQPGEG